MQAQTFKIQAPEVSSGVACLGFEDFEKIPLDLSISTSRERSACSLRMPE